MIGKVIGFELRYVFKSPVFWIISFAFFLFALLYASSSVSILGLTTAAINVNSPWAITRMSVQMSYIGLLSIAAFAGASIIRDYQAGISNILFVTKIKKHDYVIGRFLGGFIACLFSFSFLFLGIAAGSLVPWADPRALGPFPLDSLFTAFFIFVVPNIFVGCALLFSLALLTRDTLKMYVGAIAILIGFYISRAFAGAFYATTDTQIAASLIEPFGNYAATMAVLDWTPFVRNTQLIINQAYIIPNRLIWVSIAIFVFCVGYYRFKMEAVGTSGKQKAATLDNSSVVKKQQTGSVISTPLNTQELAKPSTWDQFVKLSLFECKQLAKNHGFIVITLLSIIGYWFWVSMYGRAYGTGFYPHTGLMAIHIQTVVQVPLLAAIVFLAAELVWRSRTQKFDEIMDSLPISSGALYFSKLSGLIIGAFIVLTSLILAAIAYQLYRGYTDIDLATYFIQVYLISLPYFMVFAALALFLQIMIGQRFLAMLAMVGLFVFSLVAAPIGITSNLVIPAGLVNIYHDDFAGFGHYFEAAEWIRAYWIAIAILLSIFGIGLISRGKETYLSLRWSYARQSITGKLAPVFLATLIVCLGLGAFIAANTIYFHPTPSKKELELASVRYEQTYSYLAEQVQPKLEFVKGTLDLYPQHRYFVFDGVYTLVNREKLPISEFTMTAPKQLLLSDIELSTTNSISSDNKLGVYQISLHEPLLPDESIEVSFSVASEQITGFRNNPMRTPVRYDGSLLFYTDFLPLLGYVHGRELSHSNDREDYSLAQRMPTLREFSDPRGIREQEGLVFTDWLGVDLLITTASDQIAVGQGDLVLNKVIDGRRQMRFSSSRPLKLHMGIAAGSYEVKKRRILIDDKNIDLEVYYSPKHHENVEALLDTMQATITKLVDNFGEYPYKQLRLVEAAIGRPNCRIRSDSLLCDSSMGFINDPALDDPRSPPSILVKLPAGMISNLFIQAKIMPANYPGATSIADGLGFYLSSTIWRDLVSEYSTAETIRDTAWKYFMERAKGEHEEGTVVDHVNQTFIGAHKNAVLMYGLEQFIGEESMHSAIKRFLQKYSFADEPFALMRDLVEEFKKVTPQELHYVLHDFFEERTLFDIAVKDATFRTVDNQSYSIRFTPRAKKFYSSPEGELTQSEYNYPTEVVVFGDVLDKSGTRKVLLRKTLTPEELKQESIELSVSQVPYSVGLDPYFYLLDKNYLDNTLPLRSE